MRQRVSLALNAWKLTPGLLTAALGLVGLLLLGVLAGRAGGVTLAAAGLVLFALPVLRGVALRIAPFLLWSHHFSASLADAPPVAALEERKKLAA